jgi:4-amino-4-deoxy-L-arabinose transferase-like glycosyltransferase
VNVKNALMSGALISLLILAALLRFSNLESNPGWFSDEGSDLNIARNLMEGRFQYFAITGTPLVAARVPLFHVLLDGAFLVWGDSLEAARRLTATAGFLTIILLYLATRQMMGRGLALLASFVLTIMPNAVQYSRMAFAYNLQAPVMVVCWWALWEYSREGRARWLLAASLAAASASMITLTGLPLIAVVALVVLWYKPRALAWSLPLMLAPALIYLAILAHVAPTALSQDLALTFTRSSDTVFGQFFNLVSGYAIWFDWTPWIVLGVVGLFLIPVRRVRLLTLLIFFGTAFSTMRLFAGGFDLSYHHYLGLLPFVALGAAQFLARAYRLLVVQFRADLDALGRSHLPRFHLPTFAQRTLSRVAMFMVLLAPLVWLTAWDYYLTASPEAPRATSLDSVSVTKTADAIAVTDFVNGRVSGGEVVLASPTIAWRISGNVADFQQALAYEGLTTENYGAGLPRDRFAFNPSFENATFIVLDNLWRGWASETMPPLKGYIAQVEKWPLVMHQGEFDIYRNPAR